MQLSINDLQKAAYAADDRFRTALVKHYGKNAHQARYYYRHDNAEMQSAATAKVLADKAWLDALGSSSSYLDRYIPKESK